MPKGYQGTPKAFRNPELRGRFFGTRYVTVETKGDERILWRRGEKLGTVDKMNRGWVAEGRRFSTFEDAATHLIEMYDENLLGL